MKDNEIGALISEEPDEPDTPDTAAAVRLAKPLSNDAAAALQVFAADIQQEVLARADRPGEESFREPVLTQLMIDYLAEAGEVEDASVCPHQATGIKVSGYTLSENEESLDLFITIFTGEVPPRTVTATEVTTAFKRLATFYNKAAKHQYHLTMEEAGPAFDAAQNIWNARQTGSLVQVRLILLTDGIVKCGAPRAKDLPSTHLPDISCSFQIWDIQRLQRQVSSGLSREPIEISFPEAIPCLAQPDSSAEYAAYLAIFPGQALYEMYARHGARLLERNVRSFLQARGKINAGIRQTIKAEPERFLAFNNGLSATAEQVTLTDLPGGGKAITSIRDLQIVNGGQTTASIFHAKNKDKLDISKIFVQVKLTVLKDPEKMDEVVPLISQFANSQNKVQEADLKANDSYHRQMETLSRTVWAPAREGTSRLTRWFYERARGQYQDELARAGTKAREKHFLTENPKTQLFTKTDLAKAVLTWDKRPHLVSRGAQSCFLSFTQSLKPTKDNSGHLETEGVTEPDTRYFERLCAKLILFRTTNDIVKSLQFGGYGANIVTYTIARLVHETGGWLDLGRIWKEQSVSSTVREALTELAKASHLHITDPPPGSLNVTQYCKKEECWRAFLTKHVLLPNLESTLLPAVARSGGSPAPRSAATAQSIVAKENLHRVTSVDAAQWFEIHGWASKNKALTSLQLSQILDIASQAGSGSILKVQLVSAGVKILDEAAAHGFQMKET